MDWAARQRVLRAAEDTKTENAREAAILGGIVRCVIDTKHFSPHYVKHYVPQVLSWFKDDLLRFGSAPIDMRPPSDAEIAAMLKRFHSHYDPGSGVPVAA